MQEYGKKKAVDLIDDALKENDRITREGAVSESEFISRTGKRIDTHRKGAIPLSLEATKLEMEHCGLLDLTLEELIEKDRELADVILSVIIFLESGRI